jgi:hypothetical protein
VAAIDGVVTAPPLQFDRLVWAAPGVAFLGLAAAAVVVRRSVGRGVGTAVVAVALIVQGTSSLGAADFAGADRAVLTLDEFYSPDQFDEVRMLLGDAGVARVVSVGFHPHVAVYNGFDAADGYWYSYPLEYKVRFRRLIAPALDADPGLAFYFDDWGSRAYVFQPALGSPPCCSVDPYPAYEIAIDASEFEALGVSHVLSNGPIANPGEVGLTPVGTVGGAGYSISVYSTGA